MMEGMMGMEGMIGWFMALGLVYMILLGVAYFIPAIIAIYRQHHSRWAIVTLNVLFGWTFIGWAVALIWSLTGVRR